MDEGGAVVGARSYPAGDEGGYSRVWELIGIYSHPHTVPCRRSSHNPSTSGGDLIWWSERCGQWRASDVEWIRVVVSLAGDRLVGSRKQASIRSLHVVRPHPKVVNEGVPAWIELFSYKVGFVIPQTSNGARAPWKPFLKNSKMLFKCFKKMG
jgi:hypothetical protein